jgi:hypothetical protein
MFKMTTFKVVFFGFFSSLLFCQSFPFFHSRLFSFSFFFLLAECFSLLKTDCIHCGDRCWLDLKDKSRSCPKRLTLKVQPKKKSFVYDDNNGTSDKSSCSMNQADHGTGALYIIMDAIKTLKADKEAKEKGWKFKPDF